MVGNSAKRPDWSVNPFVFPPPSRKPPLRNSTVCSPEASAATTAAHSFSATEVVASLLALPSEADARVVEATSPREDQRGARDWRRRMPRLTRCFGATTGAPGAAHAAGTMPVTNAAQSQVSTKEANNFLRHGVNVARRVLFADIPYGSLVIKAAFFSLDANWIGYPVKTFLESA